MSKILDRILNTRATARWRRAVDRADQTALPNLRRQRDHARLLKTQLDRLIQKADGRLIHPIVGSEQFPKPLGTDWSWRPDVWKDPLTMPGIASASRKAKLDPQVTLFHDCDLAEIVIRQLRNREDRDLSPFSVSLEVFSFRGSFLSLSVELPPEAATGMTRQHLVRLDAALLTERQTGIYARLNIQHGPNSEQVLRELDMSDPTVTIDFDLAHLPLNERRIDKLWLDLIIQNPAMNRVVVRDLTFCRHHRADL